LPVSVLMNICRGRPTGTTKKVKPAVNNNLSEYRGEVRPVVRQPMALSISLDTRFAKDRGVEVTAIATPSLALESVGGMGMEGDRE
jgi:hypothetical protein